MMYELRSRWAKLAPETFQFKVKFYLKKKKFLTL